MIIISILLLYYQLQTEMTITFFPISKDKHFTEAKTDLIVDDENERIIWQISSTTDESTYLRQDVGLLFENGMLKGVQSKWLENEKRLYQEKQLPLPHNNRLYEAISYHHAEIHEENEQIFSIHDITSSEQAIITKNNKMNDEKNRAIKKLTEQITTERNRYYEQLIRREKINVANYTLFPLINMEALKQWSLARMSPDKVDRMIGQLWEGLYKNYIISALQENGQGYMPIILIANDLSHLIVLYELNGTSEKLIQHIN